MRLRRQLLSSLTVSLLAFAAAQEAGARPFAALTVVPHGRQVLDFATGVTVLPDGGTVVDAETGVEVDAGRVSLLEGQYIEAEGVAVTGTFGDLAAESLRIDLVDGVLTATGGLTLVRDGLTVTAGLLTFHAGEEVVVFEGGVAGTDPVFSADRVLLDVRSGDVLLVGRYEYAGGLFTMRSPEAGGRLQLTLLEVADGLAYAAATEVSPELLERFSAYL